MDNMEQYKLLVDIYYREVNLFYSKATVFVAIQTALLAGFVALFDKLKNNLPIFTIGVGFAIVLSVIQALISIRGNAVNNALIKTIDEYEKEYGYSLLQKFSRHAAKINRFMRMNTPSYLFIILNFAFLVFWLAALLIYVVFPNTSIKAFLYSLSNTINYRTILLPLFSLLYAVTMKISDLMDEHGMHWFRGDAIVFGFLCAVTGSILVFLDRIAAQMIFAMIMGYVVRKRIDYPNHIVSFIILVISYMVNGQIEVQWFLFFFFAVMLLGLVKDLKYKANKARFTRIIMQIYLYVPIIYAVPAFVYSILTKDWTIAITFFVFDLSYNIVRLIGEKNIKNYYS